MTEARVLRCAIYTRKSSEEGLDQAFNSLEAQREACAAYVDSQRHEGWRLLPASYDDGGFSGGTLNRPALERLLTDVDAGRVDLIVVYKIDRLTRSLADFAKIVERLDARSASFVSVTQSFNTTTSMGRLTLNVLLSFAQFEREVTGERIRDKIAASKKKGMWMGGFVPLGYDAVDQKLIPNSEEAAIVRRIFASYQKEKNIAAVQRHLVERGVTSKRRPHGKGRGKGGVIYSSGALLKILANPIYAGLVSHKGTTYAGQHTAIVSVEAWQAVQTIRKERGRRGDTPRARNTYPLLGRVFDPDGQSMQAVHTTKGSRRYRYYVSRSRPAQATPTGQRLRIPARELESVVAGRLAAFFQSQGEVLDSSSHPTDTTRQRSALIDAALAIKPHDWEVNLKILQRVSVLEEEVSLTIDRGRLRQLLGGEVMDAPLVGPAGGETTLTLTIPCRLIRTGHDIRLVIPGSNGIDVSGRLDEKLLRQLALARRWYLELARGSVESIDAIARREVMPRGSVARALFGALLAPDIVRAALAGRQSVRLTVEALRHATSPDWATQRTDFD